MDMKSYAKVGGVLYKDEFLAKTLQSKTLGQVDNVFPKRSSLMMITVTPAHPMFF